VSPELRPPLSLCTKTLPSIEPNPAFYSLAHEKKQTLALHPDRDQQVVSTPQCTSTLATTITTSPKPASINKDILFEVDEWLCPVLINLTTDDIASRTTPEIGI
jgi:hypothetical protein